MFGTQADGCPSVSGWAVVRHIPVGFGGTVEFRCAGQAKLQHGKQHLVEPRIDAGAAIAVGEWHEARSDRQTPRLGPACGPLRIDGERGRIPLPRFCAARCDGATQSAMSCSAARGQSRPAMIEPAASRTSTWQARHRVPVRYAPRPPLVSRRNSGSVQQAMSHRATRTARKVTDLRYRAAMSVDAQPMHRWQQRSPNSLPSQPEMRPTVTCISDVLVASVAS
jgi:hypothetical protein